MSPSSSVDKKSIFNNFILFFIFSFLIVSALSLFSIIVLDKNLSDYLTRGKEDELRNLTQIISNDVLQSDYRSARNKLSLLQNDKTFVNFIFSGEISPAWTSQEFKGKNLKSVVVPIVFPGTKIQHSTVTYEFSNSLYDYTKKIFLFFIFSLFTLFFCTFYFSFYFFLKLLFKKITEYETLFTAVTTDVNFSLSEVKNPFLPTLLNFRNTLFKSKEKDAQIVALEKHSFRNGLSVKLAHDIQSPLSTLNMISSKIEDVELRELQTSVIKQIKLIAVSLLKENKEEREDDSQIVYPSGITFFDLFRQLEKEFQVKSQLLNKKLVFQIDNLVKEISIHSPNFLYPTLNNLIQNAIEASKEDSTIISLTAKIVGISKLEIKIIDSGKGIPPEVLKDLGKKRMSYGKSGTSSGTGIGVLNAYTEILQFGGEISIDSIVGKGTTITIRLPIRLF